MLLAHGVMDISFMFLSIGMLLILLAVSATAKPSVSLPFVRLRLCFFLPLLLFVYGFGMVAWKNQIVRNARDGGVEAAIEAIERFPMDTEALLIRMEWAVEAKAYKNAEDAFAAMPHPPAKAYYLSALAAAGQGDNEGAARLAMSCVERAHYQEQGYTLLREILSSLPPALEAEYSEAIHNVKAEALLRRHPLYSFLYAEGRGDSLW